MTEINEAVAVRVGVSWRSLPRGARLPGPLEMQHRLPGRSLEDSTVELELHVGAGAGGREVSAGRWAGKLVLASGPRRARAATS